MTTTPLQLWGGIEGSVVQVHNTWRDQVRETRHQNRMEDLDGVAALARLAQTGQIHDPALAQPGWRRRQDRLHDAERRA